MCEINNRLNMCRLELETQTCLERFEDAIRFQDYVFKYLRQSFEDEDGLGMRRFSKICGYRYPQITSSLEVLG